MTDERWYSTQFPPFMKCRTTSIFTAGLPASVNLANPSQVCVQRLAT